MSISTPYPPAPRQDSNRALRAILYALMNNGAIGLADRADSNYLLRQILYALTTGAPVQDETVTTVFANSLADAQTKSSAAVGVNNIVFILNAINPGELSAYQLTSRTPTQGSPQQFQPNDNNALTYSLVF